MRFDGTVAVVTGGMSGIGRSVTKMLSSAGAKVGVIDIAPHSSDDVACAGAAAAWQADVSDETAVDVAASAIANELGHPDVLINCAGILQRTVPPERLKFAEWDLALRVHLRGAYVTNRTFGLRMVARKRGAIVNIASIAGMTSGPLLSYGPAKAGVILLTQSLAVEWGSAGVRVNCVSPGFTETPALEAGMNAGVLEDARMCDSTALARLVRPDEVAAAACFLASDAASGITGANLPVDAGFLSATSWHAYGGPRRIG